MSAPKKTVSLFSDNRKPSVADALEQEKDITLHRLTYNGPKADNWGALSASHAYCIGSTRQEIPMEYQATAEFLTRCPDLLAVSTAGAGYDTVDVAACTAAGVLVVNQTGSNADAVAEHAVCMILALTKKIPQTDKAVRAGTTLPREQFKGLNAKGRTLGIVGLGNVGSRLARICSLGLQMNVIAYDPYLTDQQFKERHAKKVDLPTLLRESWFVSLHCPYNNETKHIIDAKALASMQKGAILINAARGGVVDEAALVDALKSGQIGGAGVDVWMDEPPPTDHPLLKFNNLIATVHTAGITQDSRDNMATWNAEQVAGILRGEKPPRFVNPEAWEGFSKRFERIFGSRPKG
jgi:D-3-phosphoglycerate dehydrogenase / 2-oxoglutarate reductase